MDLNKYLIDSGYTEKLFPQGQTLDSFNMELLHHVMGVVTEAGELMDALKKTFIYGKELDKTNLKEEIGDVLWYMAGLCRLLNTTFEEEADRNIAKLKARYPDKFNSESALNRDLEKERSILEAGVQ